MIVETISWQDALNRCYGMGGYLGCVNSKEEQDFFNRLRAGHICWLGFSDQNREGEWIGSDGSLMKYKNWHPGKPSSGQLGNYAIMVRESGAWDDIPVEHDLVTAFVCEWDHEITRRRVKKSSGSNGSDPDEVELLKTSTLKHNERIVAERKQLQKAIMAAAEEEAIVDAKSEYKRQVTSIKQDYINEGSFHSPRERPPPKRVVKLPPDPSKARLL